MEVVYIWFRKYRGGMFRNQGVNFGGRYRFHYNEQHDPKVLKVEENPFYQENFFNIWPEEQNKDRATISNITAIVGQNGTGKSSLLDYIKRDLVQDLRVARSKAIVVLYDRIEDFYYIYRHEEIGSFDLQEVTRPKQGMQIVKGGFQDRSIIKTFSNVKVKVKNTRGNKEKSNFREGFDEQSNTTYLFFSNLFDNRLTENQTGKLVNLSTNYLIHADQTNIKLGNSSPSERMVHRFREVRRQVHFLNKIHSVIPPKDWFYLLHDLIQRCPDKLRIRFVEPSFDDETVSELDDLVEAFEEWIQKNFQSEPTHRRFIMRLMLRGFLVDVSTNMPHLIFKEWIEDDLTENEWIESLHLKANTLEEVFSIVLHELSSKLIQVKFEDEIKVIRSLAEGVLSFYRILVKQIEELEGEDGQKPLLYRNGMLEVDIRSGTNFLDDLLVPYSNAQWNREFLLFDWRDLSSGEKAMLSLFSRFFSVVCPDESDSSIRPVQRVLHDHIILLIDEGELYLHPQWQKEWIFNLIQFFTLLFRKRDGGRQRTLQIILTSNSPFVASDLPASNVIFLKRSTDLDGFSRTLVLDSLDEQQRQTFAANIHHLLAHSFFLEGGPIGSFAKHKINEVIHLLVNESTPKLREQRDFLEKMIHIIGEPVIKKKLLSMAEDRKLFYNLSLDDELEDLKRRIKTLEDSERDRKGR